MRRSVELDVVLAPRAHAEDALEEFCRTRGIGRGHPLIETVLAGEPSTVVARIGDYAAAGVTDLMLGFADFPATGMLETFAREVLPAVSRSSPLTM